MDQRKDATEATKAAHAKLAARLPRETGEDFANATRGFIASIPDADIPGAWSLKPYAFLADEAPAETVNPSLWRQARLNMQHGLFEVTKGVYQVRGFELSNITFIGGAAGYVVVDPLPSAAPAGAALKLMRERGGDKPVTAV